MEFLMQQGDHFLAKFIFNVLRPGVENLKVLTRGILITFCCCHNCQNLSMFTLFVWVFLCLPKLPKYKKHSFQLAKLYLTASYCQTETNVAGDTKEGPDSFILTVFVKLAWKQIRLRQIPLTCLRPRGLKLVFFLSNPCPIIALTFHWVSPCSCCILFKLDLSKLLLGFL